MTGSPDQELDPEAYRALVEGAPAILYLDRPSRGSIVECRMPLGVPAKTD
jgi:hypothetical protein